MNVYVYAHVYVHIYMYLNATFIVQYYELISLAYFTQATPKFTKHNVDVRFINAPRIKLTKLPKQIINDP
jgi:hypothetical protein